VSEDIRSDRSASANATEVQKRAADWIFDRHDCEIWSAEDQVKLDAWLNESLAHRVAYVRLETALSRSNRLAALRHTSQASAKQRAEEISRKRPIMIAMAAILAVAALAGTGVAILLRTSPTQATEAYATALGGHKTIFLADGSRIELNTNTVLRTQIGTRQRAVWLDKGEAYFEVKHDAMRPFVVTAAGYRVRDLGTAFSVRNDANHLEVALVEGRARFEPANADVRMSPAELTPGDVVVATADKVTVTKKPERKLANQLAWRQGLLVFNYVTLADAASEFNRYNAKKLVIADTSAARLTVMGKFPARNVELFGQVAKDILGVRVEDRGGEIVISKQPTGE
jgi:transmembrane sensor